MTKTGILAVDLDGTLVGVNTFHKYLLFLMKITWAKKTSVFFKVLAYSCLRVFKLISHKKLKYETLKATAYLSSEGSRAFAASLQKHLNATVAKLVDNFSGARILATAAPERYARYISEENGLDHCIATPEPEKDRVWHENLRERKKENLLALLDNVGYPGEPDTLITDHHDDLPLMEIFTNVVLVNPSKKTLKQTKRIAHKIMEVYT